MSIHEDSVLDELRAIGCEHYRECEIVTIFQLGPSRYLVRVGNELCLPRKAPFAYAAQNKNGFQSFISELKRLDFLRDCAGIAQWKGLVLDDSRCHLKGYLYESLSITVHAGMELAMCRHTRIPWSLRQFWAKQIIQTPFDSHSRGYFL